MNLKTNNRRLFFLLKSILFFSFLFFVEICVAQDSTFQLIASRRGRSFCFNVNSQISVKHISYDGSYKRKTKGRITNITDSTITIYSLLNDKSTTVSISAIYRFSRANNSLLRWVGFISLGSTAIIAGLEGTGNGFVNSKEGSKSNGNLVYLEIPAIIGVAFCYYAIYPGLIGEACKKHYTQYGWRLHTQKIRRLSSNPSNLKH